MTKSEKIRLVVGTILLVAGLIWPVPAEDRIFGRSFTGMVIVPMIFVVSVFFFLVPVAVTRRREIWSWFRDFYRGKSSYSTR